MKSILVPAEDHASMPAVLEAALLLGRRFDSYIEGFAVRPAVGTYVAVEPLDSLTISHAFGTDAAQEVRRNFERFMEQRGVPRGDAAQSRYCFDWPASEPIGDDLIGIMGRVFDLIVLGRPGPAPEHPRMAPLEVALFESGRPALIVPAERPQSIGRNVLVAWNGSTEQARTNAFALQLLRLADTVTVLTVEGGTVPGPTGAEATRHLRRNGINATELTIRPDGRQTGEAILQQAASLNCDLVVKGAYTQSRLRQLIFGGATRHILANATIPVFMAH
jgi:nucleotide-binding universal stress UspA family protein